MSKTASKGAQNGTSCTAWTTWPWAAFSWLVQSNATNSAPLPPTYPLFHHFCRPKISQAQNEFLQLTRLVFRRRLPVQYIARTTSTINIDRLPTFCSLLPYYSTLISYIIFLYNLFSIIWIYLRIIFYLYTSVFISDLFLSSILLFSLFSLYLYLYK